MPCSDTEKSPEDRDTCKCGATQQLSDSYAEEETIAGMLMHIKTLKNEYQKSYILMNIKKKRNITSLLNNKEELTVQWLRYCFGIVF